MTISSELVEATSPAGRKQDIARHEEPGIAEQTAFTEWRNAREREGWS